MLVQGTMAPAIFNILLVLIYEENFLDGQAELGRWNEDKFSLTNTYCSIDRTSTKYF
jgi:hypothetical protein